MSFLVWAAWLATGLVALLSPLILNPVLVRIGVIDVPNKRSSHSSPTLRGGGVAQLLALPIGGAVALSGVSGEDRLLLVVVLLSACLIGSLGLAEDAHGVSILKRAGIQVAVGAACAVATTVIGSASWALVPLAAVFFAAYVNFVNFMDGINGISSLHGLVVGIYFVALGSVTSAPWLTVSGGLVAAAFVAFLPWNLIPPCVFLGDVGSYLLGGAIAAMAIAAYMTGIPAIAIISPLTIYLTDTITTLTLRLHRHEKWFMPHRQHVYQRMVDGGRSHIWVSIMTAVMSLACAAVGLLYAFHLVSISSAWVALAILAGVYLTVPRLLTRSMNARSKS